jgi:hypothetical protein
MAFPQPESEINIDKPTIAGNVKLVLLDGSGRAGASARCRSARCGVLHRPYGTDFDWTAPRVTDEPHRGYALHGGISFIPVIYYLSHPEDYYRRPVDPQYAALAAQGVASWVAEWKHELSILPSKVAVAIGE